MLVNELKYKPLWIVGSRCPLKSLDIIAPELAHKFREMSMAKCREPTWMSLLSYKLSLVNQLGSLTEKEKLMSSKQILALYAI